MSRALCAGAVSGQRDEDTPCTRVDPEDLSSDDASDIGDRGEDDEDDEPDENIARSAQWRFLARYFTDWFNASQYGDRSTSTCAATELVAAMLQLDKDAWWFLRKARKPWFAAFFPSNYDPQKLVPKMTCVLHQRWGPGDDRADAVKRLRYFLLDCDRSLCGPHADGSREARAFFKAKRRLEETCNGSGQVAGFKIPIAVQFRPEEARTPDHLRAYLQDVLDVVQAVQCESMEPLYPFRLDEITLGIHLEHAADAHTELKRLLALGVPLTVRLRHPHTHISLPFAWSDFGWRANVFPAFVGSPGPAIHKLISRNIHSSVELLSAVAFSPSLTALEIEPDDEQDDEDAMTHAKWLAYALRLNSTLRSLALHSFQGTHELLDVMESVMNAPDPARLLAATTSSGSCTGPQFVQLQSSAEISTPESKAPQSFTELNVSRRMEFPLVSQSGETIECIVPGHGICSTPVASVVSIRSEHPVGLETVRSPLTTLELNDAFCEPGVVPRLVGLVGRSLEELRWADSLEDGYDNDLAMIVQEKCPALTKLYLQGSSVRSLSPRWTGQLQTLSLMHTAVPMDALRGFFTALADESSSIARSLESFSYYCPGHSLDRAATDAALDMLANNRHLQSLSVGIHSPIYDEYESRFQDARDVEIRTETLALASKLALCSVVKAHQSPPTSAIGRLDGACLTHVFGWLTRHAYRRVRVIQSL